MKASINTDTTAKVLAIQDLGLGSETLAECTQEEFSAYVRALMQNWRQGTVASKTRAQVAFSNVKPWKQKGTGRARVGSRRSPIWRKGGVIFGPQPRVRTLKVMNGTKKRVFGSLLSERVQEGKVLLLDWKVVGDIPKTALAYKALKNAGIESKKVTLFVNYEDHLTQASFSNIPNVGMLLFDQPNPYSLADSDYWVVLSKDAEQFKGMVSRWI